MPVRRFQQASGFRQYIEQAARARHSHGAGVPDLAEHRNLLRCRLFNQDRNLRVLEEAIALILVGDGRGCVRCCHSTDLQGPD